MKKVRELEGIDFIRQKVRDRDNNTCQKCGKKWEEGKRRFDVHHLDIEMESVKNYAYDRDNQDKMITYCHKCHLSLHTVGHKISIGLRNVVRKNDERNREILRLSSEGMSVKDLSIKYNANYFTVYSVIKDNQKYLDKYGDNLIPN